MCIILMTVQYAVSQDNCNGRQPHCCVAIKPFIGPFGHGLLSLFMDYQVVRNKSNTDIRTHSMHKREASESVLKETIDRVHK